MPDRILLDPGALPDGAALERAIRETSGRWAALEERIAALGGVGAWSWGGRKYGWEKRYKRSGRPFVTLTPLDGTFSALIVLGRAEVELTLRVRLHPRVRELLERTPQLHDGRWLFLPVDSDADVDDVVALLVTKLPPRLRAAVEDAASAGLDR